MFLHLAGAEIVPAQFEFPSKTNSAEQLRFVSSGRQKRSSVVFFSGTGFLQFMLLCLLGWVEGLVIDLCKETGWDPANGTRSSATAFVGPSQLNTEAAM